MSTTPPPPGTPWYRGPLLALPILGALIVIALVVGVIVVALAALPQGATHPVAGNSARPTARPTPTQTSTAAGGSGSCWNGTDPQAGKCPALTGEDALHWVFPLADGAPDFSCQIENDPSFDPAGALDLYQCGWPDLPNTFVFLSRFPDASGQAAWTGYMDAEFTNPEVARFLIDNQDSGIALTGTSDTQVEKVYGYDIAPFFLDVGTDLSKGGTVDQQNTALARIDARQTDALQAAINAAG